MADKAETLERGDIYFFYRPKVNEQEPQGLGDVQRFYMGLPEACGSANLQLGVVHAGPRGHTV
ncbi:MAG: hypothetical protein IH624_02910 [Phycisphaerae bacterium]|nr:hypothetical protein [Phycisphaerae bacterium]